jgi:hypothetical protein
MEFQCGKHVKKDHQDKTVAPRPCGAKRFGVRRPRAAFAIPHRAKGPQQRRIPKRFARHPGHEYTIVQSPGLG